MKKITARRLAGVLAATTLSLGLVACAEDNGANIPTSEVESAVEEIVPGDGSDSSDAESADPSAAENGESADPSAAENGESTGEESTASEDAADSTEGAAEGEDGKSVSLDLADGSTVLVTEDFASEIEDAPEEYGQPVKVTEGEGSAMAEFENGDLLVNSEQHGTNKVVGEIARVWVEGGALDNEIGLPTGEESKVDDGSGWVQEFANGTISWLNDGSGTYSETVTPGGEG